MCAQSNDTNPREPLNPKLSRRSVIQAAATATLTSMAGPLASRAQAAGSQALTPWIAALDAPENSNEVARQFLQGYNRDFQALYTSAAEAQWKASTDVSDEHTQAAVAAQSKLDQFVGAKERMQAIASLRDMAWRHEPLLSRQLDRCWMAAAHAPGNIPELVAARAKAEAEHGARQNGFTYRMKVNGEEKAVSANDIDEILINSNDLAQRRAAWESSKEIGVALREGLAGVRDLRNKVGRALSFHSYFDLEVADYGISVADLMALRRKILDEVRPLYEQLHCWAKHTLAKRYGEKDVPRRIPAHWLPNRWGQEWPNLVESANLDELFKGLEPKWIIEQAERFYVSMGMPKLPSAFWQKSDLYDLPPTDKRKKNRHASAWHIDLDHDVRSLMSVKSDASWFGTTHHELGHIYYYLAYTDAGVPLMLREGANRAFHEAVGDLIALASRQMPYLVELGLFRGQENAKKPDMDQTQWLLSQAIDGNIVLMPWAWGTMTGFEHDLYQTDLPPSQFNHRWWEIVQQEQGIEPPGPRGEEFCDAASKTHINDDPAQYYDYAIGTLIVYQIHDYIARKILKQDPRNCNYYNRKDVGEYLTALLSLGATRDWRQVLRDFTGEDLSARAMMEYYAPLWDYLKKENAGRDVSFS